MKKGRQPRRGCGGASGFALPIVLIVLALLTTLAMGLSAMVSSRIQDLQQRKEQWQAEKEAVNMFQSQLYALLTGSYSESAVRAGNFRYYLDGRTMADSGLTFTVQNGAGLFPLARYSEQRFAAFARQFTTAEVARRLAAELGDWVDADSQTRFRGMEEAAYISGGMRQLPRNTALRSVEELLHLPSMTPQLFYGEDGKPGMRDLVLAGGSSYFNISTAPPQVLGPMLGLNKTAEMQLVSARKREDWSEMARLVNTEDWIFDGVSPFAPGFIYVLTYGDGSGRRIRVQVRLDPYGPNLPYQLLEWRAPYFGHG